MARAFAVKPAFCVCLVSIDHGVARGVVGVEGKDGSGKKRLGLYICKGKVCVVFGALIQSWDMAAAGYACASKDALALVLASRIASQREDWVDGETYIVPTSWTASSELKVSVDVFLAACGSIASAATKLSLVYSSTPTAEESGSICSEMLRACDHVFTSSKLLVTSCGCGSPFVDIAQRSARQILTAVHALAQDCTASKAGVVWQVCEICSKQFPKSNRAAYRHKLVDLAVQLKDSIDEFRELCNREILPDDEMDSYSSEAERRLASECILCLELAGTLYKRLLIHLDDRGKLGDFEAVARDYAMGLKFAQAATAVAEELYPPLDASMSDALHDLDVAFVPLDAQLSDSEPASSKDATSSTTHVPSKDVSRTLRWQTRLAAAKALVEQLPPDDADA